MARKSSNISILQVDPQCIARLQARKSPKGLEVLRHDVRRGAWRLEDGSLEQAVRDFADETGLRDDMVCTVLPRHDITTRILTLPTQSPEEAASMVRLSAEEYVPFTADELIIDQCILEKLPSGEALVLAALAHRDVVEGHLAMMRRAGIEPARIMLSTACLASAAAAALGDDVKPVAIVNLASCGIEALMVARGRPRYGRAIPTVQDWTLSGEDASGAMHELAIEVRGSLLAHRRESEDGADVEKVYLCSDWAEIAPAAALGPEIGCDCVVARDLVNKIVSRGADQISATPLVALGAALEAQDRSAFRINLLPASVTRARKLEGARMNLLLGAGMVAAIAVMLFGLYYQASWQRQRLIQELERQAAAVSPLAKGVAAKQEQLQILRRQVDRTGTVLELMAAIFNAAPESRVSLTRMTFQREHGINLWGHALSVDDVQDFAEALRNAAQGGLHRLAQARSVYWQQGQERGSWIFMYQIAIPFTEDEHADTADSDSD